jgi:hypothetical protein
MRRQEALLVHAFWDDEAIAWVATSSDVSGLATKVEDVDA